MIHFDEFQSVTIHVQQVQLIAFENFWFIGQEFTAKQVVEQGLDNSLVTDDENVFTGPLIGRISQPLQPPGKNLVS